MTVLRTDRKHASNCMTEENGVEKVKKRKNFFRSLRFRILIILIILGIVPGVIVTYTMLHNYQNRAVAMLTETVGDQCDILCNLIIRENYLNDTDSEVVNSKLELFSNVYNGRILLADRDFKIVSDTFHTEEGKTLLSSLAVACLKGEETSNYDARSKVLELAVPVQSPDVQQLQGVLLQLVQPDIVPAAQGQLLLHIQLLGAVVEQGGDDGVGVQLQLRHNLRHRQGVGDIGGAVLAQLSGVGVVGVGERAEQALGIQRRVVFLDFILQRLIALQDGVHTSHLT